MQLKKFSDYQGTGVGSNVVTFTFYFRSLQPQLKTNLAVLTIVNEMKSAYNYKFYVELLTKNLKLLFMEMMKINLNQILKLQIVIMKIYMTGNS